VLQFRVSVSPLFALNGDPHTEVTLANMVPQLPCLTPPDLRRSLFKRHGSREGVSMTRQRSLILLAIGLFLCFFSAQACLASYRYGITEGEATDRYLTPLQNSYGSAAKLYVYPAQSPQYGEWVNSIYVGGLHGDFVEAGWLRNTLTGPPILMTNWKNVNGTYHERHPAATLTNGTWVTVTIKNFNYTGDTWEIFLNGTKVDTFKLTSIYFGASDCATERYDTLAQNYGAWTYLQYLPHISGQGYIWTYWPYANYNASTNDSATWKLWTEQLGNSNHKVYVSDHQN
jgi:hypothetical protein